MVNAQSARAGVVNAQAARASKGAHSPLRLSQSPTGSTCAYLTLGLAQAARASEGARSPLRLAQSARASGGAYLPLGGSQSPAGLVGGRMVPPAGGLAMVIALALAGAVFGGCKSNNGAKPKGRTNAGLRPAAPPAKPPSDRQKRVLAKTRLISSQCTARFTPQVLAARNRYLSWVDPKRGPVAGSRRMVPPGRLLDQPALCKDAERRAQTMLPKLPEVEKAAAKYSQALLQIGGLLQEANTYYETRRHKQDKFEGARSLHPKLMQGWAEFAAANDGLQTALDNARDPAEESLLRHLRATEGESLRVCTLETKLIARRINRTCSTAYKDLAFAKLQAEHQQLQKAMGKLEVTGRKSGMAGAGRVPGLGAYVRSLRAFVRVTHELLLRRQNNRPFIPAERRRMGTPFEWLVHGTPGNVREGYRALAVAESRVRFDEKLPPRKSNRRPLPPPSSSKTP